MKTKRLFAQILALALCLSLLFPLTAYAQGTDAAVPADPESYEVIDPEAMKELVENYLNALGLNKKNISVGYCYVETGDTWYYNGDTWRYPASVYKVPLMMILAERESKGELTRDTVITGEKTLGELEASVITWSDNNDAHAVMNYLGTDKEVRAMYRAYSPLEEGYYNPDFLDYSYFTARFTTDVIKTLYYDQERFPNILECMCHSDYGKWFGVNLSDDYVIAQKYGSYIDRRGVEYNNDTAIIFTEHPFILTVMTQNMGVSDRVLRDMAVIFKDYTESLNEAYETWKAEQEPAAPASPAPEEAAPAPDDGSVQIPLEPDAQQTEGQQQPGTGENGKPAPQTDENPTNSRRMIVLVLGAALLVILLLALAIKPILRRKRRS